MNFECIRVTRDNGLVITGYVVKFGNGSNIYYTKEKLIDAIKNHNMKIDNIELCDNDIVIKEVYDPVESEEKLKKLINRVITLGGTVEEIETACNNIVYLMNTNKTNILYIPSNVTHPLNINKYRPLKTRINSLSGTLKVIGGNNIIYLNNLFDDCRLDILDLRDFNMENAEMANEMFKYAQIKKLIFGENTNTKKVMNMDQMFYAFKGEIIGLEFIDTSQVKYMKEMFEVCEISSLNLSKFNLSNVKDAKAMFANSKIEKLDLGSLSLSEIDKNKRDYIFHNAKIKEIILSKRDIEAWDLKKKQ